MAEEEVVGASSPVPSDHKRKLEDLEPQEASQPQPLTDEEAVTGADSDDDASEAKRPRLDDQPPDDDCLGVTENGYQSDKLDESMKEDAIEQPIVEESNGKSEVVEQPADEAPEPVNADDEHQNVDISHPSSSSIKSPDMENAEQQQPSGDKLHDPSAEDPQHVVVSSAEHQFVSETQTITRKMEIPNNKVGVLIGKAGDTIRSLQYNSGAKIQITRDSNADPYAATRPVELTGTLENINKAEKLIEDVIAEAEAGGSPSLVARGFNAAQAAGAAEQIQIQVPNEKVGTIIGKGGETIKNLQTRSGARIQLIPQHLPEGDQSTERTVRVTGDKKQIEMAREMIKEVMNQIWLLPFTSHGFSIAFLV